MLNKIGVIGSVVLGLGVAAYMAYKKVPVVTKTVDSTVSRVKTSFNKGVMDVQAAVVAADTVPTVV